MAKANKDEVLEAFDQLLYGKNISELVFIPGISARRVRIPSPESVRQPYIETFDSEYAKRYQDEEKAKTLVSASVGESFQRTRIQGPGMSLLEEGSTICGDMLNALEADNLKVKGQVYQDYIFDPPNRNPLAIDSKRHDILELLSRENAIIIKGFTGCGKTTQVPQFILDEGYRTNTPCNIVVTQPRRIAAISIAKRVCQERNWALGTVVGYQVGMDKQTQPFTCLTYMTTGCLLEMLVGKKSLEGFTHIIIDEVHERDEDTDLLLFVVRKFLRHTRNNTKVILMSATAEAGKFSQYFSSVLLGAFRNAPIIEVDSVEPHSVRVYYMDDLRSLPFLSTHIMKDEILEPKIDRLHYETVTRLIAAFDQKREIVRYGPHSATHQHISRARSAVLIFLPGLAEIENMHKCLDEFESNAKASEKNYWYILPLHSRVTGEEQSRVFQPMSSLPPHLSHYRKIILSTNIAESSLTVPDITYVIDFCLVKQLVADPDTNFCCLKTEWAPKTSCVQRKGRVGRVCEGVVYRMVSKYFYHKSLPEDVTPEILRCPLEQAVLRTKMLDLGEPAALLALVIDPPRLDNIVRTMFTLKEIGALKITTQGKLTPLDGDLTYLGRVVARLPIDVHLGKLIMLGYIFNILEECIIMAAGLNSKNIFTSPYQKKLLAYHVKMIWAEGSFSDPITILNAYQVYKTHERNEHFKRSGETEKMREKRWAEINFIQLKALKEMDLLVKEIQSRLKSMGIEEVNGPNVKSLTESQKALLLRVVIFGAFYPNYFSRDAINGQINEREAVKTMCGLDPYSTVRLQGFPIDQPPKAYLRQIKSQTKDIIQMLQEDTWNTKITFDSQRVYIQFHQEGNPAQINKIPGRICFPVYLAIKKKQIGTYYDLRLLERGTADRYIHQVEEKARRMINASDTESVVSSRSNRSEVPYLIQIPPPRLPELQEDVIEVSVCHVEEPNHFWCHRLERKSKREYAQIKAACGDYGSRLDRCDPTVPIHKGNLVMGPYQATGCKTDYFRAKVLSIQTAGAEQDRRVRLYFIDFGNAAMALVRDLRVVPEVLLKIPPLAIECYLTGVGPSLINDPQGNWTKEAKNWFQNITIDQVLFAKIFSVVNGITSVDLITDGGSWENPISKQMIELKYAVKVEETYVSKMDNETRQTTNESCPLDLMKQKREQEWENEKTNAAEFLAIEHEVTEILQFNSSIHRLQGPYNPLEMMMYGKVKSLMGTRLKVEDDSVNSVMLDDQPGDFHERVLVAASIGTQLNSTRVVARSTTLLPNIAGLPAILSLLFAPRAEFRANATRTRLTGAICGLGYDKERNSQAFYPEHDMEIAFDTEIDLNDVLLINKSRFWFNSVLGDTSYSSASSAPSRDRMREVNQKTLSMLFELITKPRKDVEAVSSMSYKWNLVKLEHLLQSDREENQLNQLISLHDCIKLVL